MSTDEEFIHITTGHGPSPTARNNGTSGVSQDFFANAKGLRTFTEGYLVDSIARNHPNHHLTNVGSYPTRPAFLEFAQATKEVTMTPTSDLSLTERFYLPPKRRLGNTTGIEAVSDPRFGTYNYKYKDIDFIVYIALGQDGFNINLNHFLLTPVADKSEAAAEAAQAKADDLLKTIAQWSEDLHREVLVFDQGFWQKNTELYNNIEKAKWKDVILDAERKETIINDVLGFFKSGERYKEYGVPWKRGVIFYGPPGNGKTISTKALMHDVSKKTSPTISNLYVKSFFSYFGPERGIRDIFEKARQQAPCLLIFEDIDSLVNPDVRSYFLNEVDGLESNDGILMIGSTNHLESLDPGIAKRPSRFDRKYLFDDPNEGERELYAEYWRHKLSKNKNIDFPKTLNAKIASITKGFSFAYIKEAFVAALLIIVARGDEQTKLRGHAGSTGGGDDFEDNIFWRELKKQIANLRKEMDDENDNSLNVNAIEEQRNVPKIERRHPVPQDRVPDSLLRGPPPQQSFPIRQPMQWPYTVPGQAFGSHIRRSPTNNGADFGMW